MKLKLLLGIAIFLMILQGDEALALQVNDTDIAAVSVELASKTMVDVNPAELTWTGLNPGSEGTSSDEANGYFAIQIENIGSHNITHIWFNVSNPSSRPFATGTNASYDAGNFVVLAREGSSNYYFPNRIDFNESRSLVYLRDFDGVMPPNTSKYRYGRIRNTSYEYFWMFSYTGTWNCGNTPIRIGKLPHTESQTGSTNFQTGSGEYDEFNIQIVNANWGAVHINAGPLTGYCLAIPRPACDRVILYKWNKDMPGSEFHCLNAEYFWSADPGETPGLPLVPGNSTVANIRVWVPYGVYEGYAKTGTLTVYVNDV